MVTVSKKKEKLEERRSEILEHFQQVLREEGFEGASIAKIASRVGVNPSLLLHYFPTKEEMVLELVDYILEKYETLGAEKITSIGQPELRLDTLLDMVFGIDWISLVDSSAFYSCYYLSFRNETVKQRMQKMYHRFRQQILIEMKSCIYEGIVNDGDPEIYTDFIISLVEGLSFTRNISGGTEHYVEMGRHFKKLAKEMLTTNKHTVSTHENVALGPLKKEAYGMIDGLQEQVARLKAKLEQL